jgi:16S rRNA (adenine1518-N6/adenine1519-N6)-dimethyltransferase
MTAPRTLLADWNLFPKKQLGQNFLADPATARMIVTRAGLDADDVVIEIGSGLGALTIPAARCVSRVYAVETDSRIIPILNAELIDKGMENVHVLTASIMDVDLGRLSREQGRKLVVMGNLPYNISSQILVKLILDRVWISKAVVMFQKELAQRLLAPPETKDYGRITVMLRYAAQIQKIAEVKAPLFYPRPQVDSQVLEIAFHQPPPFPASDEAFLFQVIKAAFGQRRKTLRNALSGSQLNLPPDCAQEALDAVGIDARRRAETLTVKEYVRLAEALISNLKLQI